jgi:enolase
VEDLRVARICAREVLDSRGLPTVEAEVELACRTVGRAAAPCGTSLGKHEAAFLRDGEQRYLGKGALTAVKNVNELIAPNLLGVRVGSQEEFDSVLSSLDPTPRRTRIGGNALYATSVAFARAAAAAREQPLYRFLSEGRTPTVPRPAFNLLNGGTGSSVRSFQEYLLIPTVDTYAEALQMAVEVMEVLRQVIAERVGVDGVRVGPSSGWLAPSWDPELNLRLLSCAVERLGVHDDVAFGIDCAASQLFDDEAQAYRLGDALLSPSQLADLVSSLCDSYNLILVEDPLHEDDLAGFASLQGRLPSIVVGDDLFASKLDRVKTGLEAGAAKGMVIKPNMVGTLSEAIAAASFAHEHGCVVVGSIRSGSTCDDPIPDVSAAVRAQFLKPGAPRSGERTACSNQMLRIAEDQLLDAQLTAVTDILESVGLTGGGFR